MVTASDVRDVALALPRTEEHLIRDHVKFRVGKIVYASISPDEATLGFGFPKDQRDALIASEPGKFAMPRLSDQRFHWVHARVAALGPQEMRELVTDAWRMVVPKKVIAAYLASIGAAERSPQAAQTAIPSRHGASWGKN
jgi:hypothetical protein